MKPLFYRRTSCRLCNSAAVEVAVPLRPLPVATPNVGIAVDETDSAGLASAKVPLDLYRCHDCGHLQILDVIDPEVQYNNFSYTTAISLGLPEHFGRMADAVIARAKLAPGSLVIEVGSNDGTALRFFKDRGMRVLGIDPARATAIRATESGIETLPTFFTEALADDIRAKYGQAQAIICTNTYANLDDLDGPTAGIRKLLGPGGLFVFETQHGADVIRRMLVDTIYHEHLSYFLVGPLIPFFKRHGMELIGAEHLPTKGGSFRGYVQLAGGPHADDGSAAAIAAEEKVADIDRPDIYRDFVARFTGLRDELSRVLDNETNAGRRIAGYGASVGTVTLINQFDLGGRLDFIADDKPLAKELVGPGYRIPILVSDKIYERKPDLIVILAWRYAEPIMAKHKKFMASGGRFAVPLPTYAMHGA